MKTQARIDISREPRSQETRERFAAFVKEQRLDNYEYSRLMMSDELLEAFLEQDRSPHR